MHGLFIVTVFGLAVTGIVLMEKERVFYAINTFCSTVIGVALVMATTYSRFNKAEHSLIVVMPLVTHRVEGKRFRLWTLAYHSLGITVLLLFYVVLLFVGTHFIFGRVLQNLDSTKGIFLAMVLFSVVLVLVGLCYFGRIRGVRRFKVYCLYHCLQLLSQPLDFHVREKIRRVVQNYNLPTKRTTNRPLNLTVNDISELVVFIFDDMTQDERRSQAVEWILDCQQDGGFGVWPGSTARLQSTYQALLILQDLNVLDRCRRDSHIQWIKERQQPDGSFEGPWSRLPAWENTFYAARSLDVLGASMSVTDLQACRDWCSHNLVDEGVRKNRADIVYYCFGTLNCLGETNVSTLELVSDWLLAKIDELLLTNVSLDYENVHFAVMTYHLLKMQSATIPDKSHMDLLIQRIHAALDAELLDVSA